MTFSRFFDILFSAVILLFSSPVILPILLIVYLQDFCNPFYVSSRVGYKSVPFKMLKIRSMVVNADATGVSSTSSTDQRITPVGKFIRRYKLDELSQFINVLLGSMSVVGPRPNVIDEVNLYTNLELTLLSVKPGITDLSSIVFSDEGTILSDSSDPDLDYNQLIRPLKSRLGIFYISKKCFTMDILVIISTVVSLFSRQLSLKLVASILLLFDAPSSEGVSTKVVAIEAYVLDEEKKA